MQVQEAGGSVTEAAKTIIKSAFEKSDQKDAYFNTYREAKKAYIIQAIEKGNLDPIEKEKQRFEKLNKEKEPIMSFVEEMPDEEGYPVAA